MPGDYDGNGVTDLSVYRVSDATWYTRFKDASGGDVAAPIGSGSSAGSAAPSPTASRPARGRTSARSPPPATTTATA